jgi:hypothetical protein
MIWNPRFSINVAASSISSAGTNPFTFIKDDKAYILFKKADGTNFVYSLIKKDTTWVIITKESKQGKVMPRELLWYLFKQLMND